MRTYLTRDGIRLPFFVSRWLRCQCSRSYSAVILQAYVITEEVDDTHRRNNSAPTGSRGGCPDIACAVWGGGMPPPLHSGPPSGSQHYPRKCEYDPGTYPGKAAYDQFAVWLLHDGFGTVAATEEVDGAYAVRSEAWV